MSAEHSSRFFVVAVIVSMAIHAFLAYLLCVVLADRTMVVGPTPPSIGTPLIVSLVSLPTPRTDSRDDLDQEMVPAEPHTDPAAQNFQSPSERSRSTENRSEADSVVISKDQGVQGLETPADDSPAADATQSIDVEASDHIARGVVRIPEFEAGLVLSSKGRVVLGPLAPAGRSFATGTAPSTGLKAAIAREVERMSITEFELHNLRFKSMALYEKNHSNPDCPGVFAGSGLALPFILKDIITGNGYNWFTQENLGEQRDLGRQKDQERLESMSNLMNYLILQY